MSAEDVPPRPYRRRPALAAAAVGALRRRRLPRLSSYAPRSLLVLSEHRPTRAAVPAVDVHAHLGRWLHPGGHWMEPDVHRLLEEMDATNVTTLANLDGRWGAELEANLDRYDRAHPGRFVTFCHVDWRRLGEPEGPDAVVTSLEASLAAGARGLKVWKDLGLGVEVRGRRILPDDPMLAPLWQAAAAARVPVLVHVADPLASFLPADRHNERLEQLRADPRGARHKGGAVEHHRLIGALERLVATQPSTRFIAAHVACCAHDLGRVGGMLERYPNLSIDIAAAASELGRQPRAARALIVGHPEQVLFGSDVFPWQREAREIYFRLLETGDDSFAYSGHEVPPWGRWPIYGLDLPAPVLERVYRDNARAVLGLGDGREDVSGQLPVARLQAEEAVTT